MSSAPSTAVSVFKASPSLNLRTNLDATDLRLVKKHRTVRHAQWPSLVGTVLKVSRGFCLVHWAGSVEGSSHWFRCNSLEVVS